MSGCGSQILEAHVHGLAMEVHVHGLAMDVSPYTVPPNAQGARVLYPCSENSTK